MKYYAQNKQDEFLDKVIFNKKRHGFFVDIGAHDGVTFSNSYFFEIERNFDGICIEPNPNVFSKLRRNRKCAVANVCIDKNPGKVKFLVIIGYGEMLSGIINYYDNNHLERIKRDIAIHGGTKHEIEVDCISLSEIRSLESTLIDYCSIDTEGNEFSIITSIDFEKIKIDCFSIENSYNDERIGKLMHSKGYRKIKKLGDDEFYLKNEKYNFSLMIRITIFNLIQKIRNQLS